MTAISLTIPLTITLAVQFMLWFNLLFPYNSLFDNFNRTHYLIISSSGFFIACISLVFYRLLVFEKISKLPFIIASIVQFFSLLSSALFFVSSLSGWIVI
jgi:hypothetical protein